MNVAGFAFCAAKCPGTGVAREVDDQRPLFQYFYIMKEELYQRKFHSLLKLDQKENRIFLTVMNVTEGPIPKYLTLACRYVVFGLRELSSQVAFP